MPRAITCQVHLSMVSLKWGDVLSTLLPGGVVLFGIAPHFPWLDQRLGDFEKVSVAGGIALLMMAALAGGTMEAITRITWERWLRTCCKPSVDALAKLNRDNLELYERGVQSSYKYVTFYANFAWATLIFTVSRFLIASTQAFWAVVLVATTAVLLRASYMQWTYYVNYQNKVFGPKE